MSQQSSCALSTAGRHHPGMVGDIISERWAASNRNAGRHHVGILGGAAALLAPHRVGSPPRDAVFLKLAQCSFIEETTTS